MTNNVELSSKNGTIANALLKNSEAITNMQFDSTSMIEYKSFIKEVVMSINDKTESKKSPATKKFLTSLEKQTTKNGITVLVYNTILAGDGLNVIN